jgi:hypothetical protein
MIDRIYIVSMRLLRRQFFDYSPKIQELKQLGHMAGELQIQA